MKAIIFLLTFLPPSVLTQMKTTTAHHDTTGKERGYAQTVNFDKDKEGTLPKGWTGTKPGSGEAKWTVEKDETAPSKPSVLKPI